MTAEQIAAVVGTERKAWWPEHVYYDGHGFYQELPMQGFASPYMLDDVTELAFIGAAVRECMKRRVWMRPGDADDPCKFVFLPSSRFIDCPLYSNDLLSGLVAALDDRERA